MSLAAVAAGADGLMIEVHPRPESALSDGEQSLTPKGFSQLMRQLEAMALAMGRRVR
jgi:3-deoxy-7-phosphoheptulonate synthase